MSTARSIHVGMSFGSPHPYGDGGALADSLGRWAAEAGYQPTLLVGANATPRAVLSEIGKAANELVSGDCLLITYTGHGGRAKDENGDERGHAIDSNGHENGEDPMDSTWRLTGGDLNDDKLAEALGAIRPGVRVVVIVDSCYSQTMVEATTPSGDILFIAAARDNSTVDAGRLSDYLVSELPRYKHCTWWDLLMNMRDTFKKYDWQGPYFPRSPDPDSASLPLYLRGH